MEDNHTNSEQDFFEEDFFEDEVERKPRIWARSVSNSVIGGVCGGLGEYFNAEPNLFRIVFVLAAFAGGWGIIVYIVALFFLSIKPDPDEFSDEEIEELSKSDSKTILGSLMILGGIYFILSSIGIFYLINFLRISNESFTIIILLSAGIKLIRSKANYFKAEKTEWKDRLQRSRKDRRLMGVCGGLAEYLNIDSTLLRVIGLISIFLTAGISIIVYFIISFVVRFEPELITNDE